MTDTTPATVKTPDSAHTPLPWAVIGGDFPEVLQDARAALSQAGGYNAD
jgi:hypothetical protein